MLKEKSKGNDLALYVVSDWVYPALTIWLPIQNKNYLQTQDFNLGVYQIKSQPDHSSKTKTNQKKKEEEKCGAHIKAYQKEKYRCREVGVCSKADALPKVVVIPIGINFEETAILKTKQNKQYKVSYQRCSHFKRCK